MIAMTSRMKTFTQVLVLILITTFISGQSSAVAADFTLSTLSTIANGATAPSPIIRGVGFASDADKFDFTVDMGLTKLKFDSVAFVDSTRLRFNLHGVASKGTITISAKRSAFTSSNGFLENFLEIVIAAPLILQTISFANVLPMKVGDKDQVINVNASSSLKVVVESNTPSVCTIDFAKIHAVAAGTCSVKAVQTGNTLYAAAATITKIIAVSANPTEVVAEVNPVEVVTQLGLALYDPDLANYMYTEVLVAGSNSGSKNSHLVKLLIPPDALLTKAVFLVSSLSSDEESAAGYFAARITAVNSSGIIIRNFLKVIEINIPAGATDSFPYWSFDKISWHRLQKLESKVLPTNQDAGYFVEADGRIAILTDNLMYFGLRKAQSTLSVISPVTKLAIGSTTVLKSSGGSGTGELGYKSSTESICSITEEGVVTTLGEGQCLVTAVKMGSETFADALSTPIAISIIGDGTPIVVIPPTPSDGFLIHSLRIKRLGNSLTLDVELSSDYANKTAGIFLGTKGKSRSWSWKKISTAPLDDNGSGVFTIMNKFNKGQKLRVMVNGVVRIESYI